MSDHELLRDYARAGSQAAFAALVERHVDLVYSVARRQVRSAHLAEEVAQSVFTDLARGAGRFDSATPIVAWLHVASRRTAIDFIRRETRRHAREQAAATLDTMKPEPSPWSAVEPLLDEAVESLDASARTAILLRYFENKSLRDVGAALGTSEDTAQKRVSRAVEQLRDFFARRGIAVSAATLASDLSAQALHTAPAGLGASIAAAAASHVVRQAAVQATTSLTMTTLQKSLAGAALVAALGGVVFETTSLRAQRAELATLRTRNEEVASQLRQWRTPRPAVPRPAAPAPAMITPPSPADAALEAQMHAWLERAAQLKRLRAARPDLVVPELLLLTDDAWVQAARDAKIEDEEQIRETFARLRNIAEATVVRQAQRALRAYLEAHNGQLPPRAADLAAYCEPPVDPAVFARYEMLETGLLSDLPREKQNALIAQRTPLDWQRDTIWKFGPNGNSTNSAFDDRVRGAMRAFADANQGMKATLPEHIMSYLPGPVDPAKLKPYLTPRP